MGILLLLLGLLAAGSGAVKLTSRARHHHGVSPLAWIEGGVGTIVVLASGVGLGRLRPLAWTVVGITALVVVVSSAAYVRRGRQARERRRTSEEDRLRRYLGGKWERSPPR